MSEEADITTDIAVWLAYDPRIPHNVNVKIGLTDDSFGHKCTLEYQSYLRDRITHLSLKMLHAGFCVSDFSRNPDFLRHLVNVKIGLTKVPSGITTRLHNNLRQTVMNIFGCADHVSSMHKQSFITPVSGACQREDADNVIHAAFGRAVRGKVKKVVFAPHMVHAMQTVIADAAAEDMRPLSPEAASEVKHSPGYNALPA